MVSVQIGRLGRQHHRARAGHAAHRLPAQWRLPPHARVSTRLGTREHARPTVRRPVDRRRRHGRDPSGTHRRRSGRAPDADRDPYRPARRPRRRARRGADRGRDRDRGRVRDRQMAAGAPALSAPSCPPPASRPKSRRSQHNRRRRPTTRDVVDSSHLLLLQIAGQVEGLIVKDNEIKTWGEGEHARLDKRVDDLADEVGYQQPRPRGAARPPREGSYRCSALRKPPGTSGSYPNSRSTPTKPADPTPAPDPSPITLDDDEPADLTDVPEGGATTDVHANRPSPQTAIAQTGKPYVLGAEASISDPEPAQVRLLRAGRVAPRPQRHPDR